MSTGGIFTIQSNAGVQDKLLQAHDFLKKRMRKIKELRTETFPHDEKLWEPTFAELEETHNYFINSCYRPMIGVGFEYIRTTQKSGTCRFGSALTFTMDKFGDFISDCVFHIRLEGLKANVFPDKVKYAEFLGHRIFRRVSFSIENNPLDEYRDEDYNIHYNFHVENKLTWLRSVGQEVPTLGYITGDPINEETREYRWIGDGPQTLKSEHTSIDLWIPLLFWFNNIKQAIPAIALDWGQVNVTVEFAPVEELTAIVDYGGGGAITQPTIEICDMYANHIFVSPEIHPIIRSKIGFSLIRVHNYQTNDIVGSGALLLNQLKFPTETIYVGCRPLANYLSVDHWHKNGTIVTKTKKAPVVVDFPLPNTLKANVIQYFPSTPCLSAIGLRGSDISFYGFTSAEFFNNYLPKKYIQNVNLDDEGWLLMTFRINHRNYDPSGYLNITNVRELYLDYNAPLVTPSDPARLIISTKALNFLLLRAGSAVLKFST